MEMYFYLRGHWWLYFGCATACWLSLIAVSILCRREGVGRHTCFKICPGLWLLACALATCGMHVLVLVSRIPWSEFNADFIRDLVYIVAAILSSAWCGLAGVHLVLSRRSGRDSLFLRVRVNTYLGVVWLATVLVVGRVSSFNMLCSYGLMVAAALLLALKAANRFSRRVERSFPAMILVLLAGGMTTAVAAIGLVPLGMTQVWGLAPRILFWSSLVVGANAVVGFLPTWQFLGLTRPRIGGTAFVLSVLAAVVAIIGVEIHARRAARDFQAFIAPVCENRRANDDVEYLKDQSERPEADHDLLADTPMGCCPFVKLSPMSIALGGDDLSLLPDHVWNTAMTAAAGLRYLARGHSPEWTWRAAVDAERAVTWSEVVFVAEICRAVGYEEIQFLFVQRGRFVKRPESDTRFEEQLRALQARQVDPSEREVRVARLMDKALDGCWPAHRMPFSIGMDAWSDYLERHFGRTLSMCRGFVDTEELKVLFWTMYNTVPIGWVVLRLASPEDQDVVVLSYPASAPWSSTHGGILDLAARRERRPVRFAIDRW